MNELFWNILYTTLVCVLSVIVSCVLFNPMFTLIFTGPLLVIFLIICLIKKAPIYYNLSALALMLQSLYLFAIVSETHNNMMAELTVYVISILATIMIGLNLNNRAEHFAQLNLAQKILVFIIVPFGLLELAIYIPMTWPIFVSVMGGRSMSFLPTFGSY